MTSKTISIQAGYIALNDAAMLIVAKECGFAEAQGIDLRLHRETSWATLRDKLAIGMFDVAHLLAPIPVASSCNLFPLPLDIVVPMALGLGGNMITLSRRIWDTHFGEADVTSFDARMAGERLRAILHQRRAQGHAKLRFGAVHPYSAHNYELRYWLAGCGIDPDHDVDIVFLPPSTMPDALKSGAVDGYCVGEPWNSAAILEGLGVLLTTKSHIWQSSPEKVLGVRRAFAEDQQEAHFALLRALYKAAAWIEEEGSIPTLCDILARPDYVAMHKEQLWPGFPARLKPGLPPCRFSPCPISTCLSRGARFSLGAVMPSGSIPKWFAGAICR